MDKTKSMKIKPILNATCKLGKKGCFEDGRCHALGNCENKIVTNADDLRSMNDKQLAIFLKPLIGTLTEEEIFKWLQTEAQEEIAITPEMKADMVDCIKETKIPGGGKDCDKCSINNTNYCGKTFCEVEWIRNKMLQEARGDK